MNRKKVLAAIRILEESYGVPEAPQTDPVDLLVMTILSQNTSDLNSLRAFGLLKSAFEDYEQLLCATEKEIADKIRAGGLAEIKAGRIKATLAKIKQDTGHDQPWTFWRIGIETGPGSICSPCRASAPRRHPSSFSSPSDCLPCRWTLMSTASPGVWGWCRKRRM